MLHKVRLGEFYVCPAYRGAGVGTKLLSSAINYTRNFDGVQQINLTASESAAAALHLYEKLGFQTWGVEPNGIYYMGKFVAGHHMILKF